MDTVTAPTPPAPATPRRRPRLMGPRLATAGASGVLWAPGLAVYALAVLVPLVLCVRYALSDYNLLRGSGPFVGMENFRELFASPAAVDAFVFTLVLTVFMVVVANAVGLALAVLLNRDRRSFHAMRTAVFVPVVLSGVVVAYLWSTILTDHGLLNTLLGQLGLDALQHSWLGTARGAQLSVMMVSTWPAIGFSTVVFLAGLQAVPAELQEAAQLDGAGPWRSFWSVSWPMLRPSLAVGTTITMINGFKSYDVSVVLTGGGPADATQTTAMQVIQLGFEQNRAGLASASALVLLAAVAVISGVSALLGRRFDA